MKTKEQVAEMLAALADMGNDDDKPPGLPIFADVRLRAMMIALAWVIGEELPGNYSDFFKQVREVAAARRYTATSRKKIISKDWLCE